MIICKMQQKEKAAPSQRSTGPGASDSMRPRLMPDTMKASRARFPPSLRQHVGGAPGLAMACYAEAFPRREANHVQGGGTSWLQLIATAPRAGPPTHIEVPLARPELASDPRLTRAMMRAGRDGQGRGV